MGFHAYKRMWNRATDEPWRSLLPSVWWHAHPWRIHRNLSLLRLQNRDRPRQQGKLDFRESEPGKQPSSHSPYYAYFFRSGWCLLCPQGRSQISFLPSTSTLSTDQTLNSVFVYKTVRNQISVSVFSQRQYQNNQHVQARKFFTVFIFRKIFIRRFCELLSNLLTLLDPRRLGRARRCRLGPSSVLSVRLQRRIPIRQIFRIPIRLLCLRHPVCQPIRQHLPVQVSEFLGCPPSSSAILHLHTRLIIITSGFLSCKIFRE